MLRWQRMTLMVAALATCCCGSSTAASRQLRQVGFAEASCYTLQITANGAGFDSVKHQLTAAEPVGGAVYASLHRCFHGILFPETAQVASVTYVVDPAAPVLSVTRKHVTPAKIDPAKVSLSPGLHTVQATVSFKDPAWKQLILKGQFTVAGVPPVVPPPAPLSNRLAFGH